MDAVRIVEFDPLEDDALLQGWVDAGMDNARAEHGAVHTVYSADEVREHSLTATDRRFVLLAAVAGDQVVGQGNVHLRSLDNLHLATSWFDVRPAWRRRGIGTGLLESLAAHARVAGRSTHVVVSDLAAGSGAAAEAFAARHGYLAARVSLRQDLAVGGTGTRPADVEAAIGASSGYDLLTWWDEVPEPWLDQRAALAQRISTDAPHEDVHEDEEVWDGERVRAELASALAMGRRVVETVSVHRGSGQLVAYTTLAVDTAGVAHQWDTLVRADHRGHRLGARVKAANLRALRQGLPAVRRVTTVNARSNEPMLRVNRELGFEVTGVSTEWQKVLT